MKNKILFLTATHGDEGFVEVFKKLEKKYSQAKYGYDWIISNERAYEKNTRFTEKDLNRSAPGTVKSNIYEEKRAAEIIEKSRLYDLIIDIHGTKSDFGIVTIITYPTIQNLTLAYMSPNKRIVIWYAKESQANGPLTQFCHCPAIEFECGPKNNIETAEKLYKALEKILQQKKSFSLTQTLKLEKDKELYAVYGKMMSESKKQTFVDFTPITINKETFYPLMGKNEYKGISCYKMKKINIKDLFIY
jgi:succinylglutamate desuccinylase